MKALDFKYLKPKEALIMIKSMGLRHRYEKILIQKYVFDMSVKDIASLENKQEQTIKNELNKARRVADKFLGE